MKMRCILCDYKEYRCKNGKWGIHTTANYEVSLDYINNMVEACPYFRNLGGYMVITKNWCKFGQVVEKIVSVSICGSVKKVFKFRYL